MNATIEYQKKMIKQCEDQMQYLEKKIVKNDSPYPEKLRGDLATFSEMKAFHEQELESLTNTKAL